MKDAAQESQAAKGRHREHPALSTRHITEDIARASITKAITIASEKKQTESRLRFLLPACLITVWLQVDFAEHAGAICAMHLVGIDTVAKMTCDGYNVMALRHVEAKKA